MNLEDLNTSQELLAAHEILQRQVQSMQMNGSVSSSISRTHEQSKMLIKNMMSQLKLKYQMIKGNEGPKDYSRQLTISSEDLIMAETWQRA